MPPPNVGPLLAGMGTTSQDYKLFFLKYKGCCRWLGLVKGFRLSQVLQVEVNWGRGDNSPYFRSEVHGDLPGGGGQHPGGGLHGVLPEPAAQAPRDESQVSPVNPWSVEKMKTQGESGHEKREDPVEAQCLQDAEQLVGLQKMHNPEQAASDSLQVCAGDSRWWGGGETCLPMAVSAWHQSGAQQGWRTAGQALPGYGGLHGRGGPGWVGYGGDLEGVGENLRTIELPQRGGGVEPAGQPMVVNECE